MKLKLLIDGEEVAVDTATFVIGSNDIDISATMPAKNDNFNKNHLWISVDGWKRGSRYDGPLNLFTNCSRYESGRSHGHNPR